MTCPTRSNAQQAILAYSIFLSQRSAPEGIHLEKRANKPGNLEQSGHTKINDFLTNPEQLIIMEQRKPGDVINREGLGVIIRNV